MKFTSVFDIIRNKNSRINQKQRAGQNANEYFLNFCISYGLSSIIKCFSRRLIHTISTKRHAVRRNHPVGSVISPDTC